MSGALARAGKEARLTLIGPYPPPWGGIAVHMRALRRLAESRGVEATVIDTGWAWERRDGSGGVHPGGSPFSLLGGVARQWPRPVHVHVPGNNLKAWLIALAASRPLGAHAAGAMLTVHSGLAPRCLADPPIREIARLAAVGYRRILCANGEIASALAGLGVPEAKLEILPAFVPDPSEPGDLPPAVAEFRERSRPLLAVALAEGPQYGAEVLCDALAPLHRALPSLGVVLFGPGTDRRSLAAAIQRSGIPGEQVLRLGELDHAHCLAVMRVADLFVRPTLADGDSVSVREALRLGTRVLASDASPRPPGVHLFRSGNPQALAEGVHAALAAPRPEAGDEARRIAERIWDGWSAIGVGRHGPARHEGGRK